MTEGSELWRSNDPGVRVPHAEGCVKRQDDEWACEPDCPWRFTGLDFKRGDLIVSVRPRGDSIAVLIIADGDPSSSNAAQVAECRSPRDGLLLQQALMVLLGRNVDTSLSSGQ